MGELPVTSLARVSAVSHAGRQRDVNEDFLVAGPFLPERHDYAIEAFTIEIPLVEPMVVAVIDGLGGHAGGEIASEFIGGFLHEHQRHFDSPQLVAELLQQVNDELFGVGRDDPKLSALGATLAGLAIAEDCNLWFNVGDSRVYVDAAGYLTQLSVDDSPAGPDGGSLTSVVLQTIGGTTELMHIEPHVGHCNEGQRFLLCTDGLTDLVSINDIERAMAIEDTAAVQRLLELALQAGGRDNISIAVVTIVNAELR
jgi:serine/threonine protein phosphatase PrpC